MIIMICQRLKIITELNIHSNILFKFIILIKDIIYSSFEVAKIIWFNKKFEPFITTKKIDSDELTSSLEANAITLTPGTICIDVSEDKKEITIHHLN